MVKVYAPALSLDASGSLAGALVFSKWKGRNYVRQLVTPANPKSGGQVGIRAMFKFLAQQWDGLAADNKVTWEDRADNMIVSPFNAYMSYNQRRWRNFTAPSKVDPATDTGVYDSHANMAATAGERSITLSWDNTLHNNGWGLLLFRSLTVGLTSAWDNCIAAVVSDTVQSYTFVDSPLVPDTYYYDFRSFTHFGKLSGELGEVNATVT